MGNRLRDSGNEYGAVTGRPRRCGWYDAVAVRYGVRINGLDALALTKLDVLDGLPTIEVCTAYRCGDRTLTEMPSDLGQLAACEPVYESLPGWTTPTKGLRRIEDLPDNARRYVDRLEAITGGSNAVAEVDIKVEDEKGNIVSARAAREDIVMASVEAMINGINKCLLKNRSQGKKQ
jgi:adenylosuccinate synthase